MGQKKKKDDGCKKEKLLGAALTARKAVKGGKQEEFCNKSFGSGCDLSGDRHLECCSQFGPPQPFCHPAMLPTSKAELFDLECDFWEERPQLGKTAPITPPQRWGRIDMQERGPPGPPVMAVGFCVWDGMG